MRQRLAYLITAHSKFPTADANPGDPLPEYAVFAERNQPTLLDYAFLEASGGSLAQMFRKRRTPHIGLALTAMRARHGFAGMVTSGEDVGLPLALLARINRARLPLFIITHGSYFASSKLPKLMRMLRAMPNIHYLCLSETLRRVLIEEFQVPETQAHNTGYGVDTHFFQPQETDAAPLIVSAGTANRDYQTLVQATRALDTPVRIAADSAWFPSYLDIKPKDLPPHIEAKSAGSYLGLRDLYGQAAFVVVPLYPVKHACGYAVIAEAMAMGKAVIATRTPSYSDFIEEGETGFYVRPGDADDLREKITYLLEHPAEAQRMGRNARRRSEQFYSAEAYCERMEQVICRVIQEKTGEGKG